MTNNNISIIILQYICPGLGAIMASIMFAAPLKDLKISLHNGKFINNLNPTPWIFMTGNCLGWCIYGYYKHDPFVLAANIPGLILSFYLNIGAIKIQYNQNNNNENSSSLSSSSSNEEMTGQQRRRQHESERWDAVAVTDDDAEEDINNNTEPPADEDGNSNHDNKSSELICTNHEIKFFYMVISWVVVLIWVGWIYPYKKPGNIVGLIVNVNLIFFYGAPLGLMFQVIQTRNSKCIHRATMIMNLINTTFWIAYSIAIHDLIIFIPNFIGLILGIIQGILCLFYPSSINDINSNNTKGHYGRRHRRHQQVSTSDDDGDNEEQMAISNIV